MPKTYVNVWKKRLEYEFKWDIDTTHLSVAGIIIKIRLMLYAKICNSMCIWIYLCKVIHSDKCMWPAVSKTFSYDTRTYKLG